MQNIIIDEHTGWEYELKGDYYYPTGRVMRNGVLSPQETPTDDEVEEEKPIGIWGKNICDPSYGTRNFCISICI